MGAPDDPHAGGHPRRHMGATAVYTTMLSMLVLSATIVGIAMFDKECYDPSSQASNSSVHSSSPLRYTWSQVQVYYFRSSCSDYRVGDIDYIMKDVNYASSRTLMMLWVYLGLNIVWCIGSILLLVSAAVGKKMHPTVGKCLHSSWFFSTGSVIMCDVIISAIFLIDLMYTSSDEDLSNFLYLSEENSSNSIHQKNLPPIIMALLFSKGVVLNVIHIALIFIIKKQCWILQKRREHDQFLQLHMASTPVYMRSPVMHNSILPEDGKDIQTVRTLPRFTNINGKFVGNNYSEAGYRPSTLQKAARHGFNYVDPLSKPWSTRSTDFHNSPSSPTSMYEQFTFGEHTTGMYAPTGYPREPSIVHSVSRNASHRSRERPASLQQGIDVFY